LNTIQRKEKKLLYEYEIRWTITHSDPERRMKYESHGRCNTANDEGRRDSGGGRSWAGCWSVGGMNRGYYGKEDGHCSEEYNFRGSHW
jgi:hypothetical protein